MVRTLHFHCQECGFDQWGAKIPQAAQPKKKEDIQNGKKNFYDRPSTNIFIIMSLLYKLKKKLMELQNTDDSPKKCHIFIFVWEKVQPHK